MPKHSIGLPYTYSGLVSGVHGEAYMAVPWSVWAIYMSGSRFPSFAQVG